MESERPLVSPPTGPRPVGLRPTVPIRAIEARHRSRVMRHLLALPDQDRYLRFGYAASDEQIKRYVDGIDFDRDLVLGIHDRRLELTAMAHLAFSVAPDCKSCAEFGVSVLPRARGRGYGSRLFDRAAVHACNEGVELFFIHALSENTVMLRIARAAGAKVERDGSESEAFLRLPPASFDTRVSEFVDDQWAELDYRLKAQAIQFRRWILGAQALRQTASEAAGSAAE